MPTGHFKVPEGGGKTKQDHLFSQAGTQDVQHRVILFSCFLPSSKIILLIDVIHCNLAESDEDDEWTLEEKEIEKLQQKLDEDLDEEDFLMPSLLQVNSNY